MTINLLSKEELMLFKEEVINGVVSRIQNSLQKDAPKEWLTEKEACNLLDVSKSTIQNYRNKGLLPFTQHGKKIMYKYVDINAFLERNYVSNSSLKNKNNG